MPFYEYFKPRLTQIVLSVTRRESDLTSRIGTSRPVHLAFHASVSHPPPSSSMCLHIFIIAPAHHLPSTLDRVPRLLSAPALSLPHVGFFYLFYTRARIHLPSLFLSFPHRRFISTNVTAARTRGSSIACSETPRNDLQRDL